MARSPPIMPVFDSAHNVEHDGADRSISVLNNTSSWPRFISAAQAPDLICRAKQPNGCNLF